MHTGSCLCGGVRFALEGKLEPIQLCYCAECRKAQGGPVASNIPVKADAFKLLSGTELLREFESSPGKQRIFCSRCGSPVFSRLTSRPDVLRVRAGLLEQPLPVRPARHAFVSDKANWWTIPDDDLPRFPHMPT
jgi:hypothetical protein